MLRGLWIAALTFSIIVLLTCGALTYKAHHQRDATFGTDSQETLISFASNCHFGVIPTGTGARFAVYSDRAGPYRGSIVGFAGETWPATKGFGDAWGIYWRIIVYRQSFHFTLLISIWWVVAIAAIVPMGELVLRAQTHLQWRDQTHSRNGDLTIAR